MVTVEQCVYFRKGHVSIYSPEKGVVVYIVVTLAESPKRTYLPEGRPYSLAARDVTGWDGGGVTAAGAGRRAPERRETTLWAFSWPEEPSFV